MKPINLLGRGGRDATVCRGQFCSLSHPFWHDHFSFVPPNNPDIFSQSSYSFRQGNESHSSVARVLIASVRGVVGMKSWFSLYQVRCFVYHCTSSSTKPLNHLLSGRQFRCNGFILCFIIYPFDRSLNHDCPTFKKYQQCHA